MTSKQLAKTLRKIARDVERGVPTVSPSGRVRESSFTCNRVYFVTDFDTSERYVDFFELGYTDEQCNASRLWKSNDIEDVRVLLLCFAACAAETGDL
jgi:hypothetical protein